MNRDEFEGNWHMLKGKIKERWAKFTDEDLSRINGKFEQFIGYLQKKYGYAKEEAENEMKNWKKEHKKKEHSHKERPPMWSEEKHNNELAHEDKDPIYPYEPEKREKSKDHGSKSQDYWRTEDKDMTKDPHHKNKKRKTG